MSSFTGATCSISPALPTGLNIDTSTCTISGTPSVATSNTTYNITADIGGTVYEATVWLSSAYEQLTPSVEGADLTVGEAMEDITFQYDAGAASGSGTSVTTTYGNGSVWMENIHDGTSTPGSTLEIVVGDTVYFDGTKQSYESTIGNDINNHELWAYNTSNETTWQVANINTDYLGTSSEGGSHPGQQYEILVLLTIPSILMHMNLITVLKYDLGAIHGQSFDMASD